MVGPMRKKRAWPPQDRDSDGETVAAFEAAVAVVKETVVRSGEVLVSAKEDLNDHQRWLKAQTAAVQADRERHERWLQRQRERQEVLERREQKRARRRARRQAAMQAVGSAVSGAVLAVRSAIWSVVARILAGFGAVVGLAASGARWVWTSLRDLVLRAGSAVRGGLLFVGNTARSLAHAVAQMLGSGVARIGGKVHEVAPSAGNAFSVAFGGLAARARDASRVLRAWLATAFAWVRAKAGVVTSTAGEALAPASRTIVQRAYALTLALWDKVARAGLLARNYAKDGTRRLQDLLPAAKSSPVEAENAISWRQRAKGFDLSQMLIIAGALLLVCGGLMLGGGLILRAKTPSSPLAEATPSAPIAWLFEHKTFPLDERSLFDYATTPEGVRIKGFAIGAVNMSDEPIASLEGVIKPDLHSEELKLELVVERPGTGAAGAQASEATLADTAPGTIPPQAPFKLVFAFPGAEGTSGLTPEEVLKESGGLLLKVHYEIGGKQKSFIQYLPAVLLEEQLAEIQAEAKGS
jgi:hypothetical protein